jgi:hypothetical protein
MILQDMIEAYARRRRRSSRPPSRPARPPRASAITAATPFAGLLANIVAYQAALQAGRGAVHPLALYSVLRWRSRTRRRAVRTSPTSTRRTHPARSTGAASRRTCSAPPPSTCRGRQRRTSVVTAGPRTIVIYESSIARFSYDAVTGPAGDPPRHLGVPGRRHATRLPEGDGRLTTEDPMADQLVTTAKVKTRLRDHRRDRRRLDQRAHRPGHRLDPGVHRPPVRAGRRADLRRRHERRIRDRGPARRPRRARPCRSPRATSPTPAASTRRSRRPTSCSGRTRSTAGPAGRRPGSCSRARAPDASRRSSTARS